MSQRELDPRKELILKVVTDDYIESAEPVGSRTIARKYNLGLSPATIRNEMADLEESGYLKQPHVSAGRIPSQQGYRYYVDMLMQQQTLNEEEQGLIRLYFEDRSRQMDTILQQTVKSFAVDALSFSDAWPDVTAIHLQTCAVDPVKRQRHSCADRNGYGDH